MPGPTPHLDILSICRLYFAESEARLSPESFNDWHALLKELSQQELYAEACRCILWHRNGPDRVVLFLSLIVHARKECRFQKLHAAVRRCSPVARLRFAMALLEYLCIEKENMIVWQWDALTDVAFQTLRSVINPFWHDGKKPQITYLKRTSNTLLNLSALASKPKAIRSLGTGIAKDIAAWIQLTEPEEHPLIAHRPSPVRVLHLKSLPH